MLLIATQLVNMLHGPAPEDSQLVSGISAGAGRAWLSTREQPQGTASVPNQNSEPRGPLFCQPSQWFCGQDEVARPHGYGFIFPH